MAIDQEMRHEIHKGFEELWGAKHAAAVMELMPPIDWEQIATKRDLALLKKDLDVLEHKLSARIDRSARQTIGAVGGIIVTMIGGMWAMTATIVDALK